ncbi:MAG TPA: AcvB/VirJ family lysyl-phosphatidylglycerol hydrolase [Steroidobacteraceae bacterium]|nr:AcvB/VirJ family lysyl-phosphatidylglycerol hydrolase [Steroidobacteraceae bacterium]
MSASGWWLMLIARAAPAVVAWLVLAPAAAGAAERGPTPGTGGDAPAPVIPGEQKLRYGPFGEVTVYRPHSHPTSVALFVSGDGGWNLGVVDMARHLTDMGALVVGIDIRSYLKAVNAPASSCRNFAVDFEGLAHEVEQRVKLPDYLPPVLVGYSSGATLVYATVVQSPKGTFAGAMSLGFCPDLAVTQSICKGSGLAFQVDHGTSPARPVDQGVVFAAARGNVTPWVAFQGDLDQVCDPGATREFVASVANAQLVWLPKVGHGFSVERNWRPQFKAAYATLTARARPAPATIPDVRDLPIVEVPATAQPVAAERGLFAVLLTGDGGWAGLDQDISAALAARGIPVVGLNTLKYFWNGRTPAAAAKDLERLIRRYSAAWQQPNALLVGYSFGADVLPFLYTRLPDDVRARVRTVSLLGLSDSASFEFHVSDWIPGSGDGDRPVAPEVARMGEASVLCLYGADEHDSPCPRLASAKVTAVALGGGHHFDGDYASVVRRIVDYAHR